MAEIDRELADNKLRVSISRSRRYKRDEIVRKRDEALARAAKWQTRLDRFDELDK